MTKKLRLALVALAILVATTAGAAASGHLPGLAGNDQQNVKTVGCDIGWCPT